MQRRKEISINCSLWHLGFTKLPPKLNLQPVLQLQTYLSLGWKGTIFQKAFKLPENHSTRNRRILFFISAKHNKHSIRHTGLHRRFLKGMDHLSRASCKVTPSLCHSKFPLKAELEVLHKAAFCRWQHLHMMYITFREPQRYSIKDVPGSVIHHRIKVRKLQRNPPW